MIDYKELATAIQNMTYRQRIYKVLKQELGAKGYWREPPRGAPMKKGFDERRKLPD